MPIEQLLAVWSTALATPCRQETSEMTAGHYCKLSDIHIITSTQVWLHYSSLIQSLQQSILTSLFTGQSVPANCSAELPELQPCFVYISQHYGQVLGPRSDHNWQHQQCPCSRKQFIERCSTSSCTKPMGRSINPHSASSNTLGRIEQHISHQQVSPQTL